MPDGSTPSWFSLMRGVARLESERVRVCTIATVEAYDDEARTCRVRPLLPVRRPNGDVVPLPVIHAVPVKTMRFGGFVIAAPLAVGDVVELTFADRSLEKWLTLGGTEAIDPEDVRAHSLSDAMAGPGIDPNTSDAAFSTGGDLVLGREDGTMQIRITAAGKASIGSDGVELLDLVSQLANLVATAVVVDPESGSLPLSVATQAGAIKTAIDGIKG